ncbi:MAG: DNA adenine methylase [Ktedonobacteraceae bacterium]|nr:DNA adenine methylase [Ktedonobacteraceae bacterium]
MEKNLCACGCGQEVPELVGKGQRKLYATPACRKRAQRSRDKAVTSAPSSDVARQVVTTREIKPILKYPGAKWSRAKWIVGHFPSHERYLEPFAGSAAAFFSKSPVEHEVLGDTNKSLTNLFEVIRTHSEELAWLIEMTPWSEDEYESYELAEQYHGTGNALEDARRFLVRCWQAHGTKLGSTCGWRHKGIASNSSTTKLWRKLPDRLLAAADRLKDVEIRNRPALELVEYYRHPSYLIYADPPYLLSTRTYNLYPNEMTDGEHLQLLDALDAHPGPVVLSGYAHPLYDDRLARWDRVTMASLAEHGMIRTEVLWLNQRAARCQQLSLFAV